jgi:hypothetical protein
MLLAHTLSVEYKAHEYDIFVRRVCVEADAKEQALAQQQQGQLVLLSAAAACSTHKVKEVTQSHVQVNSTKLLHEDGPRRAPAVKA